MKSKDIVFTIFGTPFGTAGLASRNGKLIRVCNRINTAGEFKDLIEFLYGQSTTKHHRLFKGLVQQFNLYFNGLLKTFKYSLDISHGTSFQQSVWQTLRTIPYGQTRSYQWLARSIENPKASRAIGNANGNNPLPIIIPCHRIIRKNSQLGGYTSGTDIKNFLLELEGSAHGLV